MKTMSMKSSDITRKWWLVDAEDIILGRLASRVATILLGKNKPTYSPHLDDGDFVIIINAEKIRLTGRKETQKTYIHHTGWVGGLVEMKADKIREEHPTRLLKNAIWGMLPKGVLGRKIFSKLKVYANSEHNHSAQKPETLKLTLERKA